MKKVLRIISLSMLLIAIIFLFFALSHTEWGTAFSIGDIKVGADVWRALYFIYVCIMICLFVLSVKKDET